MDGMLASEKQPDGQEIERVDLSELRLMDFRGREWTHKDMAESRILVFAFLGTQCPLVQQYTARLDEMEKKYRDKNVTFIAVDSNDQDSLAAMSAHARKFGLDMPFVKDAGQQLATLLRAERTPEVCLLDEDRIVRYRGRIDDQYGIGYARVRPEATYLEDALEAVLSGRPVEVSRTESVGCLIGRRPEPTGTAVWTYCRDIAPILQRRCVECHRSGELGPMSFENYEDVAAWGEMIVEVIQDGRMPPWHASPNHGKFANDRSLKVEERRAIREWVEAGCPYGDTNDLPKPLEFVAGWQLPKEPDYVVNVSPKPFKVPATGDVRYQYFKVDLDFTEDKWVQAAEILPGNRSVVHHILVFVRPRGSQGDLAGERGFLFGYVPGTRVQPMPSGMAKKIPANSELVFQVHYTPVGTPQEDHSKIGFVFADPSTIEYEIATTSAVFVALDIPPRASDYRVSALLPETLPECLLLSMSPHMHLRGKSFRYTLLYPDGKKDVILDIPRYDFNWQTEYRLEKAIPLPAGTRMICDASYDNSEENLNNPDPNSRVRWGDQTYEEMMIGYFHVAIPRDSESGEFASLAPRRERVRNMSVEAIFSRLDANQDGKLEPNEIPARLREAILRLDKNGDGTITRDELPKN